MRKLNTCVSFVAGAVLLMGTVGCEQLPGNKGTQGAVIGGATGAAVGVAVAKNNVLGALIGGIIGAGGGYLIGANVDKITGKDTAGAEQANTRAQNNPVTAEQAKAATTADVNHDGFVTMDEVVAMEKAGLRDSEIIDRLRGSGQVFELTEQQRNYLRNQGVSQNVVDTMPTLNREAREKAAEAVNTDVIGRPATR
ncbi:MAG TPA: glycine zipper domain-containing protein [Verrucomicrobiae bacterium]|nr:glycine zipper domain-containing protein [Verrucomicrobiae bacterium]